MNRDAATTPASLTTASSSLPCRVTPTPTVSAADNGVVVSDDLQSRINIMNTKYIVRNKNYYVFDSIPTPDVHPLPNCAYIMVDSTLMHQNDLASFILELRKRGLGEALLPSSVEVIDHVKKGGVDLMRCSKDTRRWAVITSFMIKAGTNLVKERDWFYVGEAVRQSALFPTPPPPSSSPSEITTTPNSYNSGTSAASTATSTTATTFTNVDVVAAVDTTATSSTILTNSVPVSASSPSTVVLRGKRGRSPSG